MAHLNCYLLPELFRDEQLDGATAVVIDVLRATTTITTALAAGATEVVACLEVDEARRKGAKLPQDQRLLGGERRCRTIEGFDLGNSSLQYTRQTVEGKTIVFTTTNGTKAMLRCRAADRVLLAAFVNLSAICQAIVGDEHVALVCAGTNGEITREDAMLAGAIAQRHDRDAVDKIEMNDQATLVRDAWRATENLNCPAGLATLLSASRGGKNLISANMTEDIAEAARIDHCPVVPRFDTQTQTIRLV